MECGHASTYLLPSLGIAAAAVFLAVIFSRDVITPGGAGVGATAAAVAAAAAARGKDPLLTTSPAHHQDLDEDTDNNNNNNNNRCVAQSAKSHCVT